MPISHETDQSRASYIAYLVNDFILWHLARVRERFDGDLDTALILGEVAHFNVQKNLQKVFSAKYQAISGQTQGQVDFSPPTNLLKSTNTLSISASTGIPRETVRRKIRWLEERGWISKDSKGRLIVTAIPAEEFRDFNFEMLERFIFTADKVLKIWDHETPSAEEITLFEKNQPG